MAMNFVNPSRSYDLSEHGIRFWGYDKEIEVTFILEERALTKIDSATTADSDGYLKTFDANRDKIQAVAENSYAQLRKGSRPYLVILRDSDF